MGVPVAFALMAGVLVACALTPISMQSMIGQMFHGIDSEILLAVPFFLLVGELMTSADVTNRMIRLAQTMVGHLRGGLAQVVTLFSMFFAGISGSSTADVAVLSRTVAPEMNKEGYDRAFTAALIACASTIANLIPPSIMAVVYGATGNVSIGGLFLAGIVPGVLIGIGLMIYTHFFGPIGILQAARFAVRIRRRRARLRAAADDPGHHHGRHPHGLVHADRGRHGRGRLHHLGADPALNRGISGSFRAISSIPACSIRCRWRWWRPPPRSAGCSPICAVPTSSRLDRARRRPRRPMIMFLLVLLFILIGDFMDAVPAIIIFMPIINKLTELGNIKPLHMGVVIITTLVFGLITPPYGLSLLVASKFIGVPFSAAMFALAAALRRLLLHHCLHGAVSGCRAVAAEAVPAGVRRLLQDPSGAGYICPP